MDEVITVQFDGGSRGNPGPAGIGVVLRAADGTPVVTLGRFIGRATNNVAEYKALITGLQQAKRLGAKRIIVRGDSELVVKQMRGEYRVKNPDLRTLYDEAQDLLGGFDQAKVEHNYREDNALADRLANLAMDRKGEVTDADDVPGGDGGAPARPSAATATRTLATGKPAGIAPATPGAAFACPRCGCTVTVDRPSDRPAADQGAFLCVCGVRMKPANEG